MLGELIVILVIVATVAYIYLTGSAIKSFLLLVNGLISSTVALAFFETAGRMILRYGGQWAFGGSFILIFVIVFALLNALTGKLAPENVYFGDYPDKAVRSFIAIFAGLVLAGVLLITITLMPVGTKLPYERFNPQNKNLRPDEPDKKLILNADGFVVSAASWFSRGSMSGKNSLAVFHPDFLNEIYLNRIGQDEGNLATMGAQAVQVKDAWIAPAELLSASDNQPLSPGPGKKVVIVRAGLNSRKIADGGIMTEYSSTAFTMVHIRLSCKNSDSADNLTGSGEMVYPVGFIRNGNIVECKNLNDEIKLSGSDFADGGIKWFDFVFYVPADTVPVMLQFKLNAVAQIGKLVSGDKIPASL